MEHLIKTNGENGVLLNDTTSNETSGGIWKKTIYRGVGETVPLNSVVRIHYNAYFELNDEPYDSTVSFILHCYFYNLNKLIDKFSIYDVNPMNFNWEDLMFYPV